MPRLKKTESGPHWAPMVQVTWPSGNQSGSGNETQWDQESSYNIYSHVGHDTPNFGQRRREGKILPFTKWSQYQAEYRVKPATGMWIDNQSNYSEYSGNSYWLPLNDVKPPPDLEYLLAGIDLSDQVTIAVSKIYSSGFDSLTFMAELHKTFRMFRGALTRNLDDLLSGRAYRNWLEARYGWRILVYEIRDILEVLSEFDSSRERYKERAGYTRSEITSQTLQTGTGVVDQYYHMTEELIYSVRGSVVMDIKPPEFAFNPLTTGWELVPYSFVVDWFIGVGRWFEALSALALSTDYSAAGGFHASLSRDVSTDRWEWAPGWTSGFSNETASARAIHTKRVPVKIPLTPPAGSGLSAFKVADLIALLINAAKRG